MDEMNEKFLEIVDKLRKKTELPCMSIDLVEKEPGVLDNKIGGKPYIPEGEEYPTNSKGEAMALLLQVDLKDIDLPNFTNKGTLEIFCDKDVTYPLEYTIKYYDSGLKAKNDLPDVDLSNFIVKRGYKIDIKRDYSYMRMGDYRFLDTIKPIIKEVLGEDINDLSDLDNICGEYKWDTVLLAGTISPDIAIGGYPIFTQSDPRIKMQNKLNECLFKMDSLYDNKKIFLGDDGSLFALTSKDNIKMNKFESTYVGWDCF